MKRKQWMALLASIILSVTSVASPAGSGMISYAAQENAGEVASVEEAGKEKEDASSGKSAEEVKEDASSGKSAEEVKEDASSGKSTEETKEGASSDSSSKEAGEDASSGKPAEEVKESAPSESSAQEESSASSEKEAETVSYPAQTVTVYNSGSSLADSDTLFEQYVNRQFGISSGSKGGRRAPRRNRLTGQNLLVYNALRTEIEKIANGTRTDTAIKIPLETILGTATEVTANDSTKGKVDCLAFSENVNIDLSAVSTALMNDLPYDFYWYDKTKTGGISGSGGSYYIIDSKYCFPKDTAFYTVSLKVSADYSASGNTGTCVTDGEKTSAASEAASNAKDIVGKASGSDTDVLTYFKNQICSLVDYNYDAAENTSTNYGDPWQLIYVFDGNEDTKVVCEGYSKAFKYLCDLYKSTTGFSDNSLDVYLVSGTMTGGTGAGRHMWNVVQMSDRTYLVDVTNSDSKGFGDSLFMQPIASLSNITKNKAGRTTGYTSGSVKYSYDDDMLDQYDEDEIGSTVKLSVTVNNTANGTVSADRTTASEGDKVTLTVKPSDGYSLDNLTVRSGSSTVDTTKNDDGTYSFTMPAGDVTVSAAFKEIEKYSVSTQIFGEGTAESDKAKAAAGEEVTLTVTPAEGYEIDSVSYTTTIDGETRDIVLQKGKDGKYAFTMPEEDVYINVAFKAIDYSVTVNEAQHGTVKADKATANKDDEVILTVKADDDYELDKITVNNGSETVDTTKGENGTYSFTMPAGNVTVSAEFKVITYSVTVEEAKNGTIKADKTTAAKGDKVTLTVKPDTDYELNTLSVKNGSDEVKATKNDDGTYSFTMPAGNVTVSAAFKKIEKYSVGTQIFGEGTAESDKAKAAAGEEVTLTVTPAEGYKIDSVSYTEVSSKTVDLQGTDGKYTFTMPAENLYINVDFKAIDYSVTVNEAQHGTVKADKTTANKGDKVTLTVTPEEGYELKAVTVANGSNTVTTTENDDGTYSFTLPAGNVTVSADFNAINYEVKTEKAKNGTVTADKTTAAKGEKVTLTVKPDTDYELDTLSVRNGSDTVKATKNDDGTYSFTMPAGDVEISAAFKTATYKVEVGETQNGTVTVSKTTAARNDSITITVQPDDGYEQDSLAVKKGNTRIDASREDDGTYTFSMPAGDVSVEVTFQEIKATGIDVTPSEETLKVDETIRLEATIVPDNAKNREVIWSSSDSKVATVDDKGLVTAVGAGTATITATSKGNPEKSASCSMTVKENIDFDYIIDDNGVMITEYTGSGGDVVIPDKIEGRDVVAINADAFYDSEQVTSIAVPASVSSIDETALICGSLTSITVDENNNYYSSKDGVLYNKDQTELVKYPEAKQGSFNIPDSVTSIADMAFAYCTGLTGIEIPDSVTSIGDGAFGECSALTDIEIPDGVTSIGDSTFYQCTALASIKIPDSVTSIGGAAFAHCSALTNVEIPDSVSSIEEDAFWTCTGLTSIKIPDGVSSIEDAVFSGCDGLTSIQIPNSVSIIKDRAFRNCDKLKDVYFDGTREEWDKITIGDYNDPLTGTGVTIHCNVTYTLKYDANGGENAPANQTDTNNTGNAEFTVSSDAPTRSGYTFLGWADSADAKEAAYKSGERITVDTEEAKTLYAVWEKNKAKYTVTYTDGVDGEEVFADQKTTVEEGSDTPAFSGTPAREGYTFKGWSPAVADKVTADATYTAQWEKNKAKYTVIYTDGVDGEEVFADQKTTVEEGSDTPAFSGTPAREGYTFKGWDPKVAKTVTANATYMAQWEKNPVKVTGIKVTADNTDLTVGETTTVKAAVTPADADDQTITWTSDKPEIATVDEDGKVTAVGTGTATITATAQDGSEVKGSCEINVKAKDVTYTLKYDANGGESAPADQTDTNNTGKAEFTVSSDAPTRSGYTFLGWADTKDAKKAAYKSGDKITVDTEEAKTLYAVWEKDTVPVTSITVTAAKISLNTGSTTIATATVMPSDATDKSVGWSSSNDKVATVDKNGKVTAVSAGTATITATAQDGSKVTGSFRITVAGRVTGTDTYTAGEKFDRGQPIIKMTVDGKSVNAVITDLDLNNLTFNRSTILNNGTETRNVTALYNGTGYPVTVTVKPRDYSAKVTYVSGLTSYRRNSGKDLLVTSNADNSKFVAVYVDGKEISSSNYKHESGSTKVTLYSDYVKTLSNGDHEIIILSTDGKAVTTARISSGNSGRKVSKKSTGSGSNARVSGPGSSSASKGTAAKRSSASKGTAAKRSAGAKTGDSAQTVLWATVSVIAIAGIVLLIVFKKKRTK